MMHGGGESRLRHSSWEADEQGGAIRCGAGGAKGAGRGECEPAKHAPGTVPGSRVTGAGTHTVRRANIATCRYIPRWEPYARIGHVRICAGGGAR
jgi:hypothetical protein